MKCQREVDLIDAGREISRNQGTEFFIHGTRMAKSSGKTAMAMTCFHRRDNPGLETWVMVSPRLIWQRESSPRLPAEASAQAGPFSVWGKCGDSI